MTTATPDFLSRTGAVLLDALEDAELMGTAERRWWVAAFERAPRRVGELILDALQAGQPLRREVLHMENEIG